ncbi:MAG: gfo/Idh/MocA family oxidoreductase [Firmicutes bacterium HGW-Firmicutes-21]|nr:MAG: gfo/Idh/MocA family oxidoreductase [Firmicutes bacterium HGW-Firmicutes-21]
MKNYKAAIIGCGNIFPMHAVSVQKCENASLVAICDIKEDRARAKAAEFGCNWYTDYKEMLEKEELDVIHLCLPHFLHAPVAIYCMEKGKNVLTEKPMSITLEDARAMIDTADKQNVLLGCIFQNRYNAGTVLVKEQYQSGALGKILSAKCFVTWNRSDDYYGGSDWKGTWEGEGGGVIIDQAIHTLDMLRYIIDEDIEFIEATIAKRGHAKIEVEDTAEGIIKYKSGLMTNFHAINYYSYDADVEIELACENAVVEMVSDKSTIRFFDGRTIIAERTPGESFDYGNVKSYWGVNHVKQIKNYYESLANGTQPFIPVESAYKTQEMVCAIYKSGKENKRIYL